MHTVIRTNVENIFFYFNHIIRVKIGYIDPLNKTIASSKTDYII